MTAIRSSTDEGIQHIGYAPAFDGLRGVGAVFVVAVHAFMIIIPDSGTLPGFIPGTFVFMDMFFVMSGFLITALLLREQDKTGRVNLLAFYRRRAMRLLPALYVLLAAHATYAWIVGNDMAREWDTVRLAALFSLNFSMDSMLAPVAPGLTQLWSLSMEEQFYLVWPLAVIVLVPFHRKLSVTVPVLVTSIVVVAVRRAWLWENGAEWMRIYTHTDTRADSLLFGALLSHLWVRRRIPTRFLTPLAWVSVVILTLFVAFVDLEHPFPSRGGYNLMSLAWGVVILASLEGRWGLSAILSLKPLRVLGDVSYGIYLWHVPVQVAVARHGADWSMPVRLVVSTALTGAVTWASWQWVEKPFLRWKSNIERRRSPRSTPRFEVGDALPGQVAVVGPAPVGAEALEGVPVDLAGAGDPDPSGR